jgi:RNA polymerase sigma-70 factor (ECF subfamily)
VIVGLTSVVALYERHAKWLSRRLAYRIGPDAEDVAQEAWARLLPYEEVHEVRHPRALLLRIAENVARDRARREMRYDQGVSALRVFAVEEGDGAGGQDEELLLQQLILSLPQPQRDVLVMSRFVGLSNAEIADRLGIAQKTVEWRMTKALAHCAAQLR